MLVSHFRYNIHTVFLYTTFSMIFATFDRMDTGLKIFFCWFITFFNICVMIASFHFVGTLQRWRDLLKTAASDGAIWCAVSFSKGLLTLSAPVDFEVLRCRSILSTSSVEILNLLRGVCVEKSRGGSLACPSSIGAWDSEAKYSHNRSAFFQWAVVVLSVFH